MFAAGFFSDLQGVGKVLKPILTQFFKVGEADLELIFGRGVLNNPPSLIGLNALPPCRVNLQLTTKYHRITWWDKEDVKDYTFHHYYKWDYSDKHIFGSMSLESEGIFNFTSFTFD